MARDTKIPRIFLEFSVFLIFPSQVNPLQPLAFFISTSAARSVRYYLSNPYTCTY